MIVVAALLLLLAIGLLAGGLAQGSATLQWASFTASALAAVVLGLGELRRRRRMAAPGTTRAGAARGPSTAPGGPSTAPGAPGRSAVVPGAPATAPQRAVTGPRSEPAAGDSRAPESRAPESMAPESMAPEFPARRSAAPQRTEPVPPAPGPTAPEYVVPESTAPPAAESLGSLAEPFGPSTGAHAAPEGPAVPTGPRSVGAHSAEQPAALALGEDGEPLVEEVEVTDLLLVLDLTDEVLVVDEHPRYHLSGCPHLADQHTFGIPMVEARTDGFTPCATCAPDRHLAMSERARRGGR